jgi:octaprenyl-diphosphate synthase
MFSKFHEYLKGLGTSNVPTPKEMPMALAVTLSADPAEPLLGKLGDVCRDRGLADLGARLLSLGTWVKDELTDFEKELEVLPRGARAVQQAAHHLLDTGGKHLRPMCVVLASKVGTGWSEAARQLAISVELVHTATLLHDDVVDMADTRRGQPTARTVWGNAASIFAGDWLLVEALRRIRRAEIGGLLDRMLGIIEEMILAESLQLERRGKITGSIADYFRVAEGKTAALFRWAMIAGARAGRVRGDEEAALERYGVDLGVAFQVVDDCLDFEGDVMVTGKALFTDLREGKLTYPVLVALDRDPSLEKTLAIAIAEDAPASAAGDVVAGLHRTGALVEARRLARARVDSAVAALDVLQPGPAKDALVTVAEATVLRDK